MSRYTGETASIVQQTAGHWHFGMGMPWGRDAYDVATPAIARRAEFRGGRERTLSKLGFSGGKLGRGCKT